MADGVLTDRIVHRLEHEVTLLLVLHKRVTLRHRAKADAFLQVVHLVQVLAPLAIQHGEQDLALNLAHLLTAQLVLALVVDGLHVLAQLRAHDLTGQLLLAPVSFGKLLSREARLVNTLHVRPHRVHVPLVGRTLRVRGHHVVDDEINEGLNLVLHVLALEDAATLGIDGRTLLVHDVVVLQHVLTHLGVPGLDLRLRHFDGR